MRIRHVTLTFALISTICVAVIGFASCGTENPAGETEEEETGDSTPTAVTASFTSTCTTCHDSDGIGGSIATESDLITFTNSNSYDAYVDLIRKNPPVNMTASSAAVYSDEAAKSDYAYFKAQ